VEDDSESKSNTASYTHVEEARAYIEKTGVDFLAVCIGTVHGRIKHKPRLDFARLARIREKVSLPFVIHGGTGLSDQQYHKLIDQGVAKINYYTALAEIAVGQTQSNLQQGDITYQQLVTDVRENISAEVQRCMQLWGSAGRAAEVLMQCSAWQNVEHVIVFNLSSDNPDVIYDMLNKGKQDLSKIPGVLNVEIGRSVNAQGRYGYCWLIRFAHENVLESYKNHPLHVAYADNYFRPLAADRITNDYEILDTLERQEKPLSLLKVNV
jgi:fructose-bisphosphate aldolase class II